MTTATAKRRRRSAKIQYRDMAPQDRPHYRRKPRRKAGVKFAAAKARGWRG
jgi:hypothetical protein